MIEALSALPPDAELVVTESGYYSYGEFATIMLPDGPTMTAGYSTASDTATKAIKKE